MFFIATHPTVVVNETSATILEQGNEHVIAFRFRLNGTSN